MAKKKKLSTNTILLAALYVIIGALFIIFRSGMLNWMLTIAGILALAYGIYLLLQKQWVNGIIFIALGILLILGGWLFLTFVLLIFGICLVVYGVKDLILALKKSKKSILAIVIACLTIVAGIFLIVSKWTRDTVLDVLCIITGVILIVDGIIAFLNK